MNESQAGDKQDAVQIVTEEVQIGFAALDDKGHFAAGVERDDVGVIEDGVPQNITSIRRVPAGVLLLLDVGEGVLPRAKDINTVRRLAQEVAATLPEGERVSVVQFADRVELLRDWTTDKAEVERVLETKLLSGKHARLSDAVLFAVERFATQPQASRHLVIISDGVEPAASAARRREAWQACVESNITIHFLSLTKFAVEAVKGKAKVMRPRELRADTRGTEERERVRQTFPPYGRGRPPIMYQMKTQPGGVTVNLDFKQRRLLKEYETAAQRSEAELAEQITEETGGELRAPQTADELLDESIRIARAIGAQYNRSAIHRHLSTETSTGTIPCGRSAPHRCHLATRGLAVERAAFVCCTDATLKPFSRWYSHMNTKPFLVGGAWHTRDEHTEVRASWSGEIIARVSVASDEDTDASIAVAMRAAKEMRRLPRYAVADALARMVDKLKNRRDEFARTIAVEAGKPIALARAETERAIATFTFASEEARRFTGEQIAMDAQASGTGKTGWTKRIPRGVIFGITPFNFPLNLVAHKVAPALASGNAIIVKPSPRTPLSSLLLGEIFLESGFPKGALQIVPMEIRTIDTVLKDERVAMVSFTGSASVGWDLRARSGRKAVTLELGGNAPIIVDETADAAYALERTAAAAFGYAGQTCISAQRLFVHESIYEDFKRGLINYAQTMKAGDPLDETTTLPAMIDEAAARRVEGWIEEATRDGARVLCGGGRRGAVMDATLLENVHCDMRVVAEEIFAPVATITSFQIFDEAIAHANDERYGLQAAVFTRDLRRAFQAADELEFGGVIINDAPTFRVDNMPYGGVKQSGAGREGVRYAMEEMTETRVIVIDAAR